MLVVALHASPVDVANVSLPPTAAAAEGRWSEVFPAGTAATSPTGWVLLSAPLTYVFSLLLPVPEAFAVANLAVLPGLLFAMRFALRALWPQLSSARAWALAAVAVWLPTTLAAYLNAYHPQDLAATALVAVALGLVARRQWWWAGAVFGLAVMTRQWAVLALLPALGFCGRDVWRVAAAAAAVGAVLTGPLLVVGGNEGWLTVFSPTDAVDDNDTMLSLLSPPVADPTAGAGPLVAAARVLPLLGAFAVGAFAWVRRRQLDRQPDRPDCAAAGAGFGPELLVLFAVAGLALRMVFETANYLYYWTPFAALFVLVVPYRRVAWVAVAVFSFGPWLLDSLYPPIGTITSPNDVVRTEAHTVAHAVVAFVLAAGMLFACWALNALEPAEAVGGDGDGREDGREDGASEAAAGPRGAVLPEVGPVPRVAWVGAALLMLAVVLPFAAGWRSPEPVERARANSVVQQQQWERLYREGADVGSRPITPL